MLFEYQHNGISYSLNLEPQSDGSFRVIIGERIYRVQAVQQNGAWRLIIDGQPITAHAASDETARYVKVEGSPAVTLNPVKRGAGRRRASVASNESHLTAQMPGQVIEVSVAVGDIVKSGQTLAILEAMKMEIRVSAPADGIVRAVLVKKGDIVERDQLLIDVENSEN